MKVPCKSCGEPFERTKSPKGGQPAVNCEKCRKPRGEERDPQGNKARKNARRRAKTSGAIAAKHHDEVQNLELLAVGLSVYPHDPEMAAASVGLVVADVLAAAKRAKEMLPDLSEGSLDEFGRRTRATLALLQIKIHRAVLCGDISPRDMPHAGRALAQIHDSVVGEQKERWSELRMVVIGADGKPFDPNAVPQAGYETAPPSEETQH